MFIASDVERTAFGGTLSRAGRWQLEPWGCCLGCRGHQGTKSMLARAKVAKEAM